MGFCGHYLHFRRGGRSGQTPILCFLAKHGGELSQQELRAQIPIKPGSLSEILSKLEVAGLIERRKNPDDRRQLTIKLTEEGAKRAALDQEERVQFRRRAFQALSEPEQEQLEALLTKVRHSWEDLDD
ncbi:MarR family transcriptional regulator [Collinsella sp. zg1085]|nr:MarR family transcriptional regulator [Collinsella sp. zg1085]